MLKSRLFKRWRQHLLWNIRGFVPVWWATGQLSTVAPDRGTA